MDKDRTAAPTQWVAGSVMGAAGKYLSDQQTQTDRKADLAAGKVWNAVHGPKHKARETIEKS